MGNVKLSFTTALFIFSFLLCLVVAVVFVDRAPHDEDDFSKSRTASSKSRDEIARENSFGGDAAGSGSNDDPKWKSVSQEGSVADGGTRKAQSSTDQAVAPSAQTSFSAGLSSAQSVDLPIDPRMNTHYETISQIPGSAETAAATPNPFASMSPEQVAKYVASHPSLPLSPARTENVPNLAIPNGIAGPATPTPVTQPASARMAPSYYQIQTNDPSHGIGSVGPNPMGNVSGINPPDGAGALPSLQGPAPDNTWNASQRPVSPMDTSAPGPAPVPPQGFSAEPDSRQEQNPGSGASAQQPILYPPGSPTARPGATPNRFQLPPAPTLPGPPVRDPDRPQASASPEKSPTPGTESADSTALALHLSGNIPEELRKKLGGLVEKKVAAKVNDRVLSGDQAENWAEAYALVNGKKLTDDTRRMETRNAAAEWAAITALAEDARRQKVSVADDEIEKYANMRAGFKLVAWKDAMQKSGFTPGEIDTELKDIALSEKLVEQDLHKQFDDAKIKEIYEKNPKNFIPPKRFHVQDIFKARPENDKDLKQTQEEMQRLYRQAKQGADFGLLASQASEAPTKVKNGDMGWVDDKSDISPVMAKALMDLKPGEISPVALDSDGFHIYRLIEVQDPKPGFEAGRQQVIESLKEGIRDKDYQVALANEKVEITYQKNVKVAKLSMRDKDNDSDKPSRRDGNNDSDSDEKSARSDSKRESSRNQGGSKNSDPAPVAQNGRTPLLRPYGSATVNQANTAVAPQQMPAQQVQQFQQAQVQQSVRQATAQQFQQPQQQTRQRQAQEQEQRPVAFVIGQPGSMQFMKSQDQPQTNAGQRAQSGQPEYDLPVATPGTQADNSRQQNSRARSHIDIPPGFQVVDPGGAPGQQNAQAAPSPAAGEQPQKKGLIHSLFSGFGH